MQTRGTTSTKKADLPPPTIDPTPEAKVEETKPEPKKAAKEAAEPKVEKKATSKVTATQLKCPHCNKVKSIKKEFGFRTVGGVKRPQSWCRECRYQYGRERYSSKQKRARAAKQVNTAVTSADIRQASSADVKTDAPTSQQVLVMANALLDEMRKSRVENITVHASGAISVRSLKAEEQQLHFGGRRAGDPEATVRLPH